MTSFTIQLVQGTRTWTGQELAVLSFQLSSSGQVWLKSDSCVIRRLDDRGRLLISQVDHYYPGQKLHELYDVDYDPTMEFGLRYSLKNQSVFVTLSQALGDQEFNGLVPVGSLAQVHMLTYLDVLPSRASKWLAVDDSETNIQQIVKRTVQKTYKQLFENHDYLTHITRVVNRTLRSTQITENLETHIHKAIHKHIRNVRTHTEGDVVQLHQTRQHITQNFQAGITVAYGSSSFPANILELAGVYAEDLGSQRIRIGPTALKPLITISQTSPYSVQAQVGQTLTVPSASATDPLTGNSLSVVANPASVSLGALATHTITYSCQTSAGDLSSALLTLVVQDSTSPQLVLLGSSSVTILVGDTYGSAEDAGATASDNLDGNLTSSIVTTGLPVASSAAGTQTVTYTITDSQNLSASISRSIVVQNPALFEAAGPWTSPAWYSTGLGTALTGETNLLGGGTGNGYEIVFSYKRSTDPQGVILSITDSSTSSTYYETPSTTAAVAFRIDATAGVKVRFPQSHPTWNNSRWHGDAAGVTNSNQTSWTEVTLRVWDKDSSNWGLSLSVGSNSYTRDMAKSGTGTLLIPGNTSTWTGYSVSCVETAGAVTTSQGWKVTPGGEVKDFSISAYTVP